MSEENRIKILSEEKKKMQSKLIGRHNSDESNPCLKEQMLSQKCIHDNYKNKEKCGIFFDNYKACKAFWISVKRNRKQNNIYPFLPPIEEREKMKAEYLSQQ